jgi:hypothetical protein
MPFLRSGPLGVQITVRVQPRAPRNEVIGVSGDALRLRIAAPPVDHAANRELLRFLSELLGVPPSRLDLRAGATSRTKRVMVQGMEPGEVRRRLAAPD